MVEGRDHVAGDSFIMVGQADDRAEDIYVSPDSAPANASDLDVIAAARTYLPFSSLRSAGSGARPSNVRICRGSRDHADERMCQMT